jgi:hypothetical protein
MYYLEYTEDEIRDTFETIIDSGLDLGTLCDSLNVELSPTNLTLAKEKMHKWESALWLVNAREEARNIEGEEI